MKIPKFLPGILLIASILFVSARAQDPADALKTASLIADKVIRETVFETRMVPLSYNGGIIQFSLDKLNQSEKQEVFYARSILISTLDTAGLLGLSFKGEIVVFLNGEEIFKGQTNRIKVKEYTYNRYQFQHRLPVNWVEGENEILVKCMAGPVQVLLLPVDEMDLKVAHVDASPVFEDTPLSYWITSGPWPDGSDQSTPGPESEFKQFYGSGRNIKGWDLVPPLILRELIIPETNSYQRDAYADWHYANGGTMLSILSLYHVSGDQQYLDFVKKFAAKLWENDTYFRWQYVNHHAMRGSYHRIHRLSMLDDSGGPALPLAQLQLDDPNTPFYAPVLFRIMDYVLNVQERLEDRTFSRPEPEPATVWADDLFMSVPFLLRMAVITGDNSLYDEVARQILQFNQYLSDPETGLYFHGWYHNRRENTPVRWGRANGWIIWATTEALLHMPKKHPEYKTILEIYQQHMEALASRQDPSGMWHQVLDHPDTFLESSCTAMFTMGMARGVRMGWLKKSYKEKALKAWNALQNNIAEDGTVKDICRGTGIGESVEFYENRSRFDHDPRGLGAMITAGCEIHLLLAD